MTATYVGVADFNKKDIQVKEGQQLDLGILNFGAASVKLDEVTVTATRALVEIKPDRTVFNVQGTINSTGSDAIELLRKAPSVTVDNNDNINVMGRSGVLIYIDGKRLPLSGEQANNYLRSLPADQIDRIDIITNPGAKYEAEGNAGIIDIRLKKNENHGTNGTINGTISRGELIQSNAGFSLNHRNKKVNIFGNAGVFNNSNFTIMDFDNYQNGFFLDESNDIRNSSDGFNIRLGTDYYINDKHTIGVLFGGNYSNRDGTINNTIGISNQQTISQLDSFLLAETITEGRGDQNTYNVNYRFDDGKGKSLNIDLDYGTYKNTSERRQPNQYFEDASQQRLLTEEINVFDTPTDIDIYTGKIDYEDEMLGGKVGIGTKLSRVVSDNTFLFFDEMNGTNVQNNYRSNLFNYEENVYAGYLSYSRTLNQQWSFTAGIRAEQTDAIGTLDAFLPELQEPPVDLNYLSWFPSAGLTWNVKPMHTLSLNYGRRINRPDYNVLNPFNNQLSQLSFEKGNPFLRPEIVNNIDLGYTLKYRYNFKIGYSLTEDQITRLISPDDMDARAGFITWDNLATQQVLSASASLPMQLAKKWGAFMNFWASYIDNQADYGDGAVVDVQAFTYGFYQQHTFDLPSKFKLEISGYFSGPGVWGGVFKYNPNGALNVGLQRKFLADKLNVKLAANDIFYTSGWNGASQFNGLRSEGQGRWDSRRVALSLSYNFGNDKVKSRKRNTGLEDEAKRVGGN